MKPKTNFIIFILTLVFLVSCSANIEIRKKQEESLRNFGRQYFMQGDYTAALAQLIEAEKIYNKDPDLHNELGLTYMKKGKFDLAIQHLKKAVQMKPDFAYARNNLGTAYMEQKQWDKAIDCFKPLLNDLLYNTPHIARSNLANAYYNKKLYNLAKYYYNQALAIKPEYLRALHGLGLTYMAEGKYQDALACIEKAVDLAPDIPALNFDLAKAFVKAGQPEKAVSIYQKVIELDKYGKLSEKAQKAMKRLKN